MPGRRVLHYARSSYYHQSRSRDEARLEAAIARLAEAWPTYGYRRITALQHREQVPVNRKHVARLMREMGLQRQRPMCRPRTTDSAHPYPRYPNLVQHLEITHPDHVWVGDITYVRLQKAFVYLAVVMDVYTRAIRGWHLSRHLDQSLILTALRRALAQHQPAIHHSDRGATGGIPAQHARHVYDLQGRIVFEQDRWTKGAAEERSQARRASVPSQKPNIGLQPTPYSLRSSVAPAFGSG